MCLVVAENLICKHIGYMGIQKLNCQFSLGKKKHPSLRMFLITKLFYLINNFFTDHPVII